VNLDVVTIGEAMVLLLAEQPGPLRDVATFRRFVAGAESNVAIALNRLGHHAGWISRVGGDEFGKVVLSQLRGEGVDTSQVRIDADAPTGVFFRERRAGGTIEVTYYRRGSAASRLTPEDLDATFVAAGQFLHLTGILPALSSTCREVTFAAADIARAAGVAIVLDVNYRRKLWPPDEARAVLRDLAERCDVVLAGSDEAQLLTGDADPARACRSLLALGPRSVVVKLGPEGSMAMAMDETAKVAPPPVQVVDPVGAGDSFAAGYLASSLRGLELADRLAVANRCGALAATVYGDSGALRGWDDVRSERPLMETLR